MKVFQVMAVTRNTICKKGLESLSRGSAIIYYASVFLYFWVFSTPVVSLVFGSYLYICINWLHIHFDEAFSSLRIANYKAFTRFHITDDGDLEVFTLAVDKVIQLFENAGRLPWTQFLTVAVMNGKCCITIDGQHNSVISYLPAPPLLSLSILLFS